ncbi:MAG TPA: organomercurial lyase [Streptosporangiaceae bacterium]|nr:organomercurial lyase [Streptosporangiaceae bacterium]
MLELTVLTVPGCPNAAVIGERLAGVLADYPAARLVRHVVHDEAETARLGMHGSPTLLVNGVDPFAAPGTPVSISCRIYRDESGRAWGAPSVAALRLALRQAAGPSARPGLPGAAGRGGRDRLAPAEGGLRAVHQRVLRAFAETGKPPSAAELDAAAAPFGTDGRTVLALLHAGDFLRLEAGGAISAAYPFSAAPTAHVVQIQDGPAVFSMCAIDALGIAAMLGRPVTISSAEPGTGRPITVTVPAGGGPAVWEPAGAVVYAGQQSSCGTCAESVAPVPPAAADVCCGFISFFTTAASATAWASAHPEITGQTLTSTKPRRPASRSSARFCGPAHERFDNGIIESASTTYGCQMNEVSGRVLAEAVRDRASSDDPLVLLEAAIVVAGETSGAADDLIEHYVGAARAASVSWTVIGEQLGVSRQAARQKFAHRLEVSDVITIMPPA